jgi:hypothetical protein
MLDFRQIIAAITLMTGALATSPAATAQRFDAAYPEDVSGLQRQIQQVIRAYYAGDMRAFEQRAQVFALPQPEMWLGRVFGPDHAQPLADDYRKHFRAFQAALARNLGRSRRWDVSSVQVWPLENLPSPSRIAPRPDAPKPQEPVDVQRYQFSVAERGGVSSRWVDSFVYVDGAFRFIGQGAFPFWDYPLFVRMKTSPSSASGR